MHDVFTVMQFLPGASIKLSRLHACVMFIIVIIMFGIQHILQRSKFLDIIMVHGIINKWYTRGGDICITTLKKQLAHFKKDVVLGCKNNRMLNI